MKKKDKGPENNYVMVALVHVYNLFNAQNKQQTIFLCSSLSSLRFEKCESSEF